jgi:hypothetical protein
MVQRRAARFVTGQYNRYQSVTSMLQELKWTSYNRDDGCVCILLDFFAAFIEVPPKECQNAICFGGSLINVVVSVEVIP